MARGLIYEKDTRDSVKTRDNLVVSRVDVARRYDIENKPYTTLYTSMNLC